jgi:SAM-dependent methyltransferase
MDITSYNKRAWNRKVNERNEWTLPISEETATKARAGDWTIVLTPTKPVPKEWYPELKGKKVLALASGGGQQAPILAIAGADVTVFDNSSSQLQQDVMVAEREGLQIKTIEGDMQNMPELKDNSFDFIFHPISNCFVPDVNAVWREAYRVLKPGGIMLAGFVNPIVFALDPDLEKQGIVQFKYKIPYSDLTSLTDIERKKYTDTEEPLAFGHSLEDQLGGQLKAGFHITAMFEDSWPKDVSPVHGFINCYIATRSIKPI